MIYAYCQTLRPVHAVQTAWGSETSSLSMVSNGFELRAASSPTLLVPFGAPNWLNQHDTVIKASGDHCCSSFYVLQLASPSRASSKHQDPFLSCCTQHSCSTHICTIIQFSSDIIHLILAIHGLFLDRNLQPMRV